MPLINKRWDGNQFRTGATFRRWTGSAWKSGATVRTWNGSDWIPGIRFECTGGRTFTQGAYTYHVFMNVGDWPLVVKGKAHKIEWVIFGGGGGMYKRYGSFTGGCGAATLNTMPASTGHMLEKGNYTVRVGAGGNGFYPKFNGGVGVKGESSEIVGIANSLSKGGGGPAGMTGGSSGGVFGGAVYSVPGPPDKLPEFGGTITYANTGGVGHSDASWRIAGGGGGAGGVGEPWWENSTRPDGGPGRIPAGNWFTAAGVPLGYVCGGGAGSWNATASSTSTPLGGAGGGGDYLKSGVIATGGGAGEAAYMEVTNGGSGAVMIRYITPT